MLLEMLEIYKSFPGVLANRAVNFNVDYGEIHTLLGENGAGKSTLMNILYGLYSPDSGEIRWKGKKVNISTPRAAIDLGIGMVHQHFMLIPKLTVVENIILGMHKGRNPRLSLKPSASQIAKISEEYGLDIDPWAVVGDLSVGAQQRVEIIKALYRGAELLILDEPTAVLTPSEVEQFFKVLQRLKEEHHSIIFISHKLDEVLKISDRISILRDGQMVKTLDNHSGLSKSLLANLMVGREINMRVEKNTCCPGEVVLKVENLTSEGHGRNRLRGLSFEIHRGEIFGIAGVDGNGQSELSEVIMGLRKLESGKVTILGQVVTQPKTVDMRHRPIAYIPEDRHNVALIPDFSIEDNLVLSHVSEKPFGGVFYLNKEAITSNAQSLIRRFNIATPAPTVSVSKLSGGNQQKVVLAREMSRPVDLIIAAQPTRGLDIDATRFVFDTILAARDMGAAVLYISTELEEIISLCDQIGVIFNGQICGILPSGDASLETLGLLMTGESLESSLMPGQG